MSDDELTEFVNKQENVNTKRKTAYEIQLFREFIQAANLELLSSTSIHELSAADLNDLLSKLIYGVRKRDGSEYEPTTLRGFLASIRRYLKSHNYGFTIFGDVQFKTAMATLKAKQK
jgi:integrase